MNIVIDFANVRQWNLENVAGFYKKYGIYHTLAGEKYGREHACKTSQVDGVRFQFECFNEIEEEQRELRRLFILPNEKDFELLWEALLRSQHEYKIFLDECIRGNLDISFINSRIATPSVLTGAFFRPSSNPWKPSLDLIISHGASLETWIDAHGIIFPILRGDGESFSRVKRCLHCGNYFVAKSQKAIFCSAACRRDNHRARMKGRHGYTSENL